MNKATEAREEDAYQPVFSASPVVGIGASAGGLEALIALFSELPSTTSLAFVVVQHLDPKTPSLLSELLGRVSSRATREAEEGMAVEPDHVYVCPSHAELTLEEGIFHLSPSAPKPSGRPDVIDHFLISLSHARGSQAVGVLLSGTGSDGTAGLQAIRAAGGRTFAQDPTTAAFPQMPQHAIATGCVDHILSPKEIAHALAQLAEHAPPPSAQPPEEEEAAWTLPGRASGRAHRPQGTARLHAGGLVPLRPGEHQAGARHGHPTQRAACQSVLPGAL